jgi:hypothetical protein
VSQEIVPADDLTVGLHLYEQLKAAGAATDQGLILHRLNATYAECEAIARMCVKVRETANWVLGDILLYAERFGESYAQLEAATGYRQSTLMNYVSVSKRVPLERRRPNLSHGHHAEVAALDPAEQDEWLDEAERQLWNRDDLRTRLRALRMEGQCEHRWVCQDCGETRG